MPSDPMQGTELACMRCGYELRGSDPSGACPECAVPVADSIRACSRLSARTRTLIGVSSMMSALAAIGWFPLAAFAFERVLPPLLSNIVEWIFGYIDIVLAGAVGFGATGLMLALQTVLLMRVLGWRGRSLWVATIAVALTTLACGIMLLLATLRLRVDTMEVLLLIQSIAGLVVAALWGRIYHQVTRGRWRWATVKLVVAALATAAWTYVVMSPMRDDPWLWVFVIGTVFNFGSCAAMGRACLRPSSRPLEHRREPLPDADAQ